MIRRAILVAVLASALLASPAAAGDPLAVANAAWPGAPCAGRLAITFDAAVGERGHAEEAVGIIAWADRPWELRTCDLLFDPVWWARADPEARCLMLVHGAGHLDSHDHAEHGVMAPTAERGSVPACMTVRARIIRDIAGWPGVRAVSCSPWQGRVLPCVAYSGDRETRYRARVRGDAYAISRVKHDPRPWWATPPRAHMTTRPGAVA